MNVINSKEYFPKATKIPSQLYLEGTLNQSTNKFITIVGTRKPSLYGKAVVQKLISGLKGLPISIISGLALGIDSIVHEAALSNNIHTIAIPGSGLLQSEIYPRSNVMLANRIIKEGGALISPWESQKASPWTFPARNAVMAGISDLVIIIEAKEDSGTMITAREALKRNIRLGAVPHNIDNICGTGPNSLLKNGAHCITSSEDVIKILGLSKINSNKKEINFEHKILKYLTEPRHRDQLALLSEMPIYELNTELTMLEIEGEIIIDNNGFIRSI